MFFELALSAFNLLKTVFLLALPVFLIVLVAWKLHSLISEKTEFSWLKVSFISTYLIVTLLIFVLYVFPLVLMPSTIRPVFDGSSLAGLAYFWVFEFIMVLVKSLILTLLILPLELAGALFYSWLDKKFPEQNSILKIFVSIYLTVLASLLFVLFVIPWIFPALVMLVYGGF